MSFAETALLGALAGFTIFLGLPFGRMHALGTRTRVALAFFAVGVLAFIFVDVMEHAVAIVETAVEGFKDESSSLGHAILLTAMLGIGFALGLGGLGALERRLRDARDQLPPISGGAVDVLDPELVLRQEEAARARALRTGMTIAAAIGLHNFAEGLAIGVSANAGDIGLATVLIIGFALHNATEGFGIVGPLGEVRPSWKWLGVAGLVGGGPTFLGSMLGYSVSSEPLELAFYALAGGAILYVIGEIWNGMRRYGHRELALWLLATGFLVGVITDMVVVYGGG
ncbi:MAG TPA: ZIP family metal transporter [Solirubrobacterales bacterium]|nr:ZIP family metal transporter [Solirubrobacterales bacterium]